jgi:hypothetical protein
MPRRRKTKSKRKQTAILHNCGIAAWRRAAAEYLRRGRFIHLPKKGTEEHAAMKARQKELMPVVQKEIDLLIINEKLEEKLRKKMHNRKRQKEIARLSNERTLKREAARLNGTLSDCSDTDTDLDMGEHIPSPDYDDADDDIVTEDRNNAIESAQESITGSDLENEVECIMTDDSDMSSDDFDLDIDWL